MENPTIKLANDLGSVIESKRFELDTLIEFRDRLTSLPDVSVDFNRPVGRPAKGETSFVVKTRKRSLLPTTPTKRRGPGRPKGSKNKTARATN